MLRRIRRAGATLSVLAIAGSLLALGAPGASATPTRPSRVIRHALIPATHGLLPTRSATVSSLNWSGYADAPGGGVTSVTGNWIVPAAGLLPPGFAASWTGIGGYNTQDLIQAGTTEDTLPIGGPQYYAWYEILPASETPIAGACQTGDANCTVNPGDNMSVSITNQGGNSWLISMTDSGHWSFTKSLSYNSSESSAEWILEAPTLVAQTPIANVGVNTFDRDTYVAGGTTHTIAQGNPDEIQLLFGIEATPSALDADGDGFNSCTYSLSCATPGSS
jgi:hypothetical protein